MRKIGVFVLAIAAMSLWSCGKVETPEVSESHAIRFSMLTTKADTYVNLPDESVFTVAGRKNKGSSWNGGSAVNAFGSTLQNVSTDGTGACTYSPAAYWSSNSVYRFRAVYPIAPDQVSYTDDLNGNAVITNFTVNASASSQKDLMLSDLVERTLSSPVGTPSPVDIVFRHLLCKVYIKIIEDVNEPSSNPGSDEFNITGVRLTGMPDKGTYTGTSTSGSWNIGSAGSLSCVNNTAHTAPTSYSAAGASIWSDGLMLIPQQINSSNSVSLVLSYQFRHSGGEWSTKSVTVAIPDITWEAGKEYTYQLAMSEESYIHFGNITVEQWGNTQASGSVIIK